MKKIDISRIAQTRLSFANLFLREAIEIFRNALNDGATLTCPCCDKVAKIYKRRMYREQIKQLLDLRNLGGENDFVHISRFGKNGGDFAKLAWWGLAELQPKDQNDKSKSTSGLWRITDKGKWFIRGQIKVPVHAIEYNGKVMGFSERNWGIADAWGKGFDLQELMAA